MTVTTQPEVRKPETVEEIVGHVLSGKDADGQPLTDEYGKPTRWGWRKISRLLQQPMGTRSRPGRGGSGRKFEYITARQAAERLDAVVGCGNWSSSFRVLDLEHGAVECTLTVCEVSKADVGYPNDADNDPEDEPLKAAYSDAFKRAAVQFGIGRWLYQS
jgi:hypothetical protein